VHLGSRIQIREPAVRDKHDTTVREAAARGHAAAA